MTISELLSDRGGLFSDDTMLRGDLIALDAKDGKILLTQAAISASGSILSRMERFCRCGQTQSPSEAYTENVLSR